MRIAPPTGLPGKRHAQMSQKCPSFFIRLRRGDDGYIQTLDLVYLIVAYLREDYLFLDSHREVPPTVEPLWADSAKVTNPGERRVYQSIEKLIHSLTPEGYHASDWISLPQLERCD